MEGINVTTSQSRGGLLGNPETPSSAISLGSGIISYAGGTGVLDIGGTISLNKNIDEPFYFASSLVSVCSDPLKMVGIEGNEISPLRSLSHHFYYSGVSRIRPSEVITGNKLWQKNLNIIQVTTFMGKFSLKYRIDDYKKVYFYLLENEHLTPLIEYSVAKLEEYFVKNIKDMVLKIQSDPEDESNDGSLYLELISTQAIDEAFKVFTKFQKEWFVPTLGAKIAMFNVILK